MGLRIGEVIVGLAGVMAGALFSSRRGRIKGPSVPGCGKVDSEVHFRSVFEGAAIGIGRVRFEDARWIDVNQAFCDMLGRSKAELLRLPWTDITHPADIHLDLIPFQRMRRGEIEKYTVEKRFLHRDGRSVWARLTLSLVRDSEGKPDYEIAVIEDITERKRAEEAFRISEERLSLAIKNARVGFYDWDLKRDHLVLSEQMMRDWGIAPGTFRETIDAAFNVIHPADRQKVRDGIERAIHDRKPYDLEYRVVHPDGKTVWVDVHGTITYDQDGTPLRFFGTSVDITERRLSMDALQRNEAKFRTFTQAMPQMAFISDPAGNMLYFNDRHYDYFGVPRHENEGWKWQEQGIVHPEDRSRTVETWKKSLGTGELYEIQYRLRRHDGLYRWHLGRAVPLRDADGKVLQWLGTNTDIHEGRIALEGLAKSEAKLRTVLSRLPIGVAIADLDGQVREMNQACREIWGGVATGFGIAQYRDFEGYWVNSGQRLAAEDWGMARALKSGETSLNELIRIRSFDGHWKVIRHSAMPAKTEAGELVGAIVVIQDITEEMHNAERIRKAKEEADRANLAKSQFLANMSHEIRTPIGAIVGFADLLKGAASEADRGEFARIIERNSQQLLRLIDDILDLSKVEAGRLVIDRTHFSFSEFLTEFASVMSFKATEKGIAFHLRTLGPLPDFVCTDQVRLRQILANVVGNAIKFTEKGVVELTVRIRPRDQMEFTVSDTGIGISEAQASALFQPFVQADASTTRKFGGTGLGLALSRRLAEALGGDLELVWSEPGHGSRFVARIAYAPGVKRDAIEGKDRTGSPNEDDGVDSGLRRPLAGIRVLVVEDSPDNRTLVSTYLRRTGAEVLIAEDGRQGVDRARTENPDVVLMDIQMPNMDGHEATRRLRAEGFSKPIVALTAHAMKEERDRCFDSGCSDYLTKPLRQDLLIESLARHTARR